MRLDDRTTARRVVNETDRQAVIDVLRATYLREKRWVTAPESQIPPDDLERGDVSWFVVNVRTRPACCGCFTTLRSRPMPNTVSS